MTTSGITGVLGQRWRADVDGSGTIVPWDGSPPLGWHVAADDRWHSPGSTGHHEAVRQTRVLGAPVYETRLRIPGGDAVHRTWSVADAGGLTVVELVNDSPLPIACALTRADLLTARPPTDVPIQGIDLDPTTTVLLPIGHRSTVVVALPHDGRVAGPMPKGVSTASAVARGWVGRTEVAGRVVLPDEREVEAFVAARCDVLLAGPPSVADDPVAHLLALGQLVRGGEVTGDELEAAVPDAAAAVHDVALHPGWDVDAALDAAAVVMARAGERRAVKDIARIVTSRGSATPVAPRAETTGVRTVAAIERALVAGPVLLRGGIPPAWRGSSIEAHGLPAGPASTISFAVRWHGERPAVLWEVTGDPVELRAPAVDPSWRASSSRGEALWAPAG